MPVLPPRDKPKKPKYNYDYESEGARIRAKQPKKLTWLDRWRQASQKRYQQQLDQVRQNTITYQNQLDKAEWSTGNRYYEGSTEGQRARYKMGRQGYAKYTGPGEGAMRRRWLQARTAASKPPWYYNYPSEADIIEQKKPYPEALPMPAPQQQPYGSYGYGGGYGRGGGGYGRGGGGGYEQTPYGGYAGTQTRPAYNNYTPMVNLPRWMSALTQWQINR